jgi:hypothetical protein
MYEKRIVRSKLKGMDGRSDEGSARIASLLRTDRQPGVTNEEVPDGESAVRRRLAFEPNYCAGFRGWRNRLKI